MCGAIPPLHLSHRGVLLNFITRVALVSLCPKKKLLQDGTPMPKHVSDTLLSEIRMVISPHSLFGLSFLLAFRHYYRTNYNRIHWTQHISQLQNFILRARTMDVLRAHRHYCPAIPVALCTNMSLPPRAVLKRLD